MLASKKLLIAAVCCSVAGHCSVMYGMNNNGSGSGSSSQPTPLRGSGGQANSSILIRARHEQLLDAVCSGNVLAVKKLIELNRQHPEGKMIARLEQRALVNWQYKDRMTALMFAVAKGHPDIVNVLLKAIAKESINAKNSNGKTALDLATEECEDAKKNENEYYDTGMANHYTDMVNRYTAIINALGTAGAKHSLEC